MSEELIIEQPSSGTWLSPGKRIGHLVAIFNCTEKKMEFDTMSGKEKEKATFDFVDLDQECALMPGFDNHPGVTFKLKVGNTSAVLGRISTQPSRYAQDAVVLGEHTEADALRLRAWHKAQAAGFGPSIMQAPSSQRAPVAAQAPLPAPVAAAPAVPVAAPVPVAAAPVAAPAAAVQPVAPGVDAAGLLAALDPATLALLVKASAQQGAATNGTA